VAASHGDAAILSRGAQQRPNPLPVPTRAAPQGGGLGIPRDQDNSATEAIRKLFTHLRDAAHVALGQEAVEGLVRQIR